MRKYERAIASIVGEAQAVVIERKASFGGYYVAFWRMSIRDGDWAPKPQLVRSCYVGETQILARW